MKWARIEYNQSIDRCMHEITHRLTEGIVFNLEIGQLYVQYSLLIESKCAECNISPNVILCCGKNQYIEISELHGMRTMCASVLPA